MVYLKRYYTRALQPTKVLTSKKNINKCLNAVYYENKNVLTVQYQGMKPPTAAGPRS